MPNPKGKLNATPQSPQIENFDDPALAAMPTRIAPQNSVPKFPAHRPDVPAAVARGPGRASPSCESRPADAEPGGCLRPRPSGTNEGRRLSSSAPIALGAVRGPGRQPKRIRHQEASY